MFWWVVGAFIAGYSLRFHQENKPESIDDEWIELDNVRPKNILSGAGSAGSAGRRRRRILIETQTDQPDAKVETVEQSSKREAPKENDEKISQ
jgi:hypothetical protein